jgi:hypothetical protein
MERVSLVREVNFGGNLRWLTKRVCPTNEADVLAVLKDHGGQCIRVLGSLHSWSDIASNADISLDLRHFAEVEPFVENGRHLVRVGAGATLHRVLDVLHGVTDQTLPTLGVITRQTVSGAISTGTHGSGRSSLSHYVVSVRLAAFNDTSGGADIRDYSSGDVLRAARCGLGCVGIILSLVFETVPRYLVRETIRRRASLGAILAAFDDHALTQFICTPHNWTWLSFERAAVSWRPLSRSERLKGVLFRIYNTLMSDVGFHLLVLLAKRLGPRAVRGLFRLVPRLLPTDHTRIDKAEHVLTLGHHYFQHEEMELFVPESKLEETVEFLRTAIIVFASADATLPFDIQQRLNAVGLEHEPIRGMGPYLHHYVLSFRRVLPEDTLVSMGAAIEEPSYSISLFTYDRPDKRGPYYAFCFFVARSLARLVGARLHWGKHFPLTYGDVEPLYPEMETFRKVCIKHDPSGVLRNGYTSRVLALPAKGVQTPLVDADGMSTGKTPGVGVQ